MNKENFLFGVIGLLAGLIIGFMFANSVNQSAVKPMASTTMSQNPNVPPGHPDIAGGGGGSGEMSPQIQAIIDKAKQNPNDFDAQIKAAEVYYQIQRFEGAIEYLKQANKLKPDDYETIVNLGNAYFDANNYTEAEKSYAAALAKKPEDINVRTDLGLTFIFRQPPDYERAIQEFQRSLAIDANHPQTLQNLTVAYTKKGDAAKAKEAIARLEGIDPTNASIPKLREEIQKLEQKPN